ncbi:MAG TPA: hypothetical protein VGN17_11600 [Bryobacteraceae bacterium]|jgi:hypothetical protein
MTLTPFVLLFAVSGAATAGLALYRKWGLAMKEDDLVHIDEAEGRLIPQQVEVANKIHSVDVAGKTLTALTAVAGVLLAVVWVYGQLNRY